MFDDLTWVLIQRLLDIAPTPHLSPSPIVSSRFFLVERRLGNEKGGEQTISPPPGVEVGSAFWMVVVVMTVVVVTAARAKFMPPAITMPSPMSIE